ncbi:hypothetical protein TcBrA4_0030920 [Trypanosoma cruzi]|nr:hypothetical protein TcBrA4_0030920 [Trypanosoma cruzi]
MLRRIPDWGMPMVAHQMAAGCGGFFSFRGVRNTRHDSCNEELTSSHFELQDIPVDRLTHRYWDDVNTPYDMFLLDEFPFEEGGVDTAEHIFERDRQLLLKEYL